MKIFINFNIQNEDIGGGLWGGANQFFLSLKKSLIKKGVYTDDPVSCDIFLMNSHHEIEDIWRIKALNPKMKIVHRIDGPIQRVRGADDGTDKRIYYYNMLYANATIFQSEWSKNENLNLGFKSNNPYTIIHNGCDDSVFFPAPNKMRNNKTKLVASSWSNNINKGLDYYKFLDENLDFNQYEFTFVGRIKYNFKNSNYISPQNSIKLAEILRQNDIYITASMFDPCSNSLLESLYFGLPANYINYGGHSELIKSAGIAFHNKNALLEAVEKLSGNIGDFSSKIDTENIEQTAENYIKFFRSLN